MRTKSLQDHILDHVCQCVENACTCVHRVTEAWVLQTNAGIACDASGNCDVVVGV